MSYIHDAEHIVMLRDSLRRFIEREMPREKVKRWDKQNEFPCEVHAGLAELGLMGITVPEQYGGSGVDIPATIAVIEELCARSMAVGCAYIQATCYAGLNIQEVGSEQQKAELLPQVAQRGMMFAYGLSEPDVGSDLASVKTVARRVGEDIVINGAKRFCSGARIADYIYTLVRTGPDEQRYRNLTLLLVPTSTAGLTFEPQDTLGLKGGGTYDVSFTDVVVSPAAIVGGEDEWNQGWPKLVGPGLDIEKLEVAAMALGIARAAVEDAWQYSRERIQFRRPICANQSVRHMLADAKAKWEACRLMTSHSAGLLAAGEDAGVETSMAKLFVCETCRDIVLSCQQVMGAYGYVRDFDMERYVRDILVMPILGGSSAIQRNNISNRLGLPR